MTAIDKGNRERIRRACKAFQEDYILVISPEAKETVEVSIASAKELERGRKSEHGMTEPVTITYKRESERHGTSIRHFHSFEEFEEELKNGV